MKKYIYKLIYENYETGSGEPDFEKYFLSFLKMKKFKIERGKVWTKKKI